MKSIEEITGAVNQNWMHIIDMLNKKISLKAVSSAGMASDNMYRSAQYVSQILQEAGIKNAHAIQVEDPEGKPGAWEVVGSRTVSSQAPTVLLYAHHDVQPVPDASVWKTDPWKGTEVDGRLYGRGSSDDGAGIMIHVGALAALGESLGVNVKIYIEGEEEIGSPCFSSFLRKNADVFDADTLIITDSSNWSSSIPSLTSSLRGNSIVDVTVRVLNSPVHSGSFGGPILDPLTVSSLLISRLYDSEGNIIVPGIQSADPIGGLDEDIDEKTFRKDSGVVRGYRFAGEGSLASRLWTKPSLTVIGIDAPDVDSSFNVIIPEVRLRLSMRVCPLQDSMEAARALVAFLEDPQHIPFGAEVHAEVVDAGKGWAMDPHSVITRDAEAAYEEAFGRKTVNHGEGGSIPMVAELQEAFPRAKVLVDGPEDPQSNAHAPNESQDMEMMKKAIVAEALLLQKLARKQKE